MGLLYCLLTVTLRANQNVTGLAMTTFGVGVGNFFGGSLIKLSGSEVPSIALSGTSYFFHRPLFAESEGWFYQDFLSYGFMVYLAIAIGFFVAWFMKHTRTGLHLRAVGENPNTADAASINVTKYKYMATCIGSMIAVIFTIWRSNVGVFASILFGGLYILHMYIPTGSNPAVKELYKMLPYIVTIVVLCISSLRKKREDQPPQHLGLPYFREER